MCKKYLAKLKQIETSGAQIKSTNESDVAVEELEKKIKELEKINSGYKSEKLVLTEDMTSKYQVIEELQNEVAEREQKINKLINSNEEKEENILTKDEIIRDLKHKLEETPEMNTVQVDIQQS